MRTVKRILKYFKGQYFEKKKIISIGRTRPFYTLFFG